MKNKFIKTAVFLCTALLLSSCSANKESEVTFRTVVTEGINAYIAADLGTSATTGESLPEETEAVTEEIVTSKSTKHYETTIPETLIGGTEISFSETLPEITTKPPETEAIITTSPLETLPKPEVTSVSGGAYNVIDDSGLLISEINGHYWALMPCWGTYGLCESWAESVNTFKEKLPDVNVYNMVVPTSSEFYVPEGFDDFTASQWKKIDHIRACLKNVKNVDAYSVLAAHTDEAIFSRTDHHWFPLGGYYAAQAFAVEAGVSFPYLDAYKKVTRGGFVGSMYMYTESSLIYNDPEQFDLYIPPDNDSLKTTYYDGYFKNGYSGSLITSPDASGYYCSFLGADNIIAEIETGTKNGRTLVIFKESYGNAVVPFLTSSFEKIYVCDIRYFYLNAVQFCKDVGATDLLFSVCTFTPAGTNGNYLGKILNY